MYEKCALATQNDVNIECKNIASESSFLLGYKNIAHTNFLFVGTDKKRNLTIKQKKNRKEINYGRWLEKGAKCGL